MVQTAVLQSLVQSIIEHQKAIIGSLAIDQAKKVPGITVQNDQAILVQVKDTDDTRSLLSQLVKRYSDLFGMTSVEVCREAIKESQITISQEDLPEILRK